MEDHFNLSNQAIFTVFAHVVLYYVKYIQGNPIAKTAQRSVHSFYLLKYLIWI